MRSVILVLFFSLVGNCLMGQTYHQSMYWLRYQNQLTFSPTWYWHNDIDNRRFIGPDVQAQLIFHTRLHYKMKKWDLASGVTYSIAYAAIPEEGYDHSTHEIRPVIEASYEVPLGHVHFAQRLRMDNRFFQEDPDESVFSESYYVMRLRYRAQVRFPVKRNEKNETTIGMRIADEIMVNDRENFFDQNRIYVSGEFFVSPKINLTTEYIYIYQQRYGREEFFSRNVVRFTLIHKINLK